MPLDQTKIVSLIFEEVVVPANPGAINAKGADKPLHTQPLGGKASFSVQFDDIPKILLRMELENGVVGWGEFHRAANWGTIEDIAQGLLGTALCGLSLRHLAIPHCAEYDGFELAIWDAWAKCLDLPLYQLLGGKNKDKVLVTAWSGHQTVDDIGAVAKRFQDQGYRNYKFKCDLEDDVVGLCAAVAKHAPKLKITLDPNQRWQRPGEVRSRLRALEKIGNVLVLEDPVAHWRMSEYRHFRDFTSINIARHVSSADSYQGQRSHNVLNAVLHDSVDGFNFNGNLKDFQDMDTVASMADLPCWHGSGVDLGILEARYVHQAAAARSCIWASDIFGRLIRSHDLLKTPLEITPPFVQVPNGPGIGVEPDQKAIEKFRVGGKTYEWQG